MADLPSRALLALHEIAFRAAARPGPCGGFTISGSPHRFRRPTFDRLLDAGLAVRTPNGAIVVNAAAVDRARALLVNWGRRHSPPAAGLPSADARISIRRRLNLDFRDLLT